MFFPSQLTSIMSSRGVTIKEAAALGGISLKRYSEVIEGTRIPSIKQVKRLAENLAVPYYAFFSETFVVEDVPIVDFRKSKPEKFRPGALSKSIFRNIRIQQYFAELYKRIDIAAPNEIGSIDMDENPEQMAQSIRFQLGLDEFQTSSISKKEFYRELRKRIQKLGVFVLQDHNISDEIDGFSLFHENFSANLIFLNSSKRNSGRRAFTLAHELAHILGKRSAISNDYESDNEVEHYCNQFAASLLIPRNLLSSFVEERNLDFSIYESAISSARIAAGHFKSSISAVLVRANQIGLSPQNYYFEFAKSFGEPDHLDTVRLEQQRGGPKEGPDQGLIAAAYLGERGAALIAKAIEGGQTTPLEVCEQIGLSKKRVEGLVRLAKSQGLEL